MDIIRISLTAAGLLCIVFLLPSCVCFSIWQKKKLHAVFKKSKIDTLFNSNFLFETRQKSGIQVFKYLSKRVADSFIFWPCKSENTTERKTVLEFLLQKALNYLWVF